MRPFLLAVALTAIALPALAQDQAAVPPSDQMCLTWLSLAARFAPEGEQAQFDKQFMALDESVTARADLSSQDRSTQAEAAQTTYDSWVESHLMASDSAKAAMLGKLLADAAACAALVPPAPDTETVLPK